MKTISKKSDDDGYVFSKYITLKSGKRIYHPTSVFRFKPKGGKKGK